MSMQPPPPASSSKRKHPSYSSVAPPFAPPTSASSSGEKRTRFAEADSDEAHDQGSLPGVDIDLLDQDAKRNQQGRKGRVVTDGYDSEESEDEDEQEEPAGGEEEEGEEDDEDMFGDGVNDGGGAKSHKTQDKAGTKGKGKEKEGDGFLSLGDIEGQEFDGRNDQTGEVLSDESDAEEDRDPELELEGEEEEDEDGEGEGGDGGEAKSQKAKGKGKGKGDPFDDMGHKLSSFNMKSEMQSGRFDAEGNYLANARDPHAQHDAWLAGNYSRKSIRAAREAKEKREQEARIQEREEKMDGDERWEGVREMVEMMREEETVLETLQRLGREAKKWRGEAAKAAKGAKRGKKPPAASSPEGDGEGSNTAAPSTSSSAPAPKHPSIIRIERFTALASRLSTQTHGLTDIYDEEYRSLLRQVRRAGVVPQDWDPARAAEQNDADEASEGKGKGKASAASNGAATAGEEDQWEYKWATAVGDEAQTQPPQTFGPFRKQDLEAWRSAGYFGAQPGGTERIVLRRRTAGGDGGAWRKWDECFA